MAHHERGQAGGDKEGPLRALSFHRHADDPELQRGGLGQVLRQRLGGSPLPEADQDTLPL